MHIASLLSLVPRPSRGRGKEGLVLTVCSYAIIFRKNGVVHARKSLRNKYADQLVAMQDHIRIILFLMCSGLAQARP